MITTLLYLVFVLSALLLIVVVLIQEGKGGGLGDAFGGAGQQTFGVGTQGITRFTSYVAAVMLITAIGITLMEKRKAGSIPGIDLDLGGQVIPDTTPAGGGAGTPAGGGSAPPDGN